MTDSFSLSSTSFSYWLSFVLLFKNSQLLTIKDQDIKPKNTYRYVLCKKIYPHVSLAYSLLWDVPQSLKYSEMAGHTKRKAN